MKFIALHDQEIRHLKQHGKFLMLRKMKHQPPEGYLLYRIEKMHPDLHARAIFKPQESAILCPIKCPYGHTGQKRFVKEAFTRLHEGMLQSLDPEALPENEWRTVYRADGVPANFTRYGVRWNPPSYMKPEYSRFVVTVEIGAKRIKEVTEEEAKDNGVAPTKALYGDMGGFAHRGHTDGLREALSQECPGSWDRNDFFWFTRLTVVQRMYHEKLPKHHP